MDAELRLAEQEKLLVRNKNEFKKFMTNFFRLMKTQESYETIVTYLRMGRTDLVIRYIDGKNNELYAAILASFLSGANYEAANLVSLTTRFNIPYSFNITDHLAVSELSELQRLFIDRLSMSNRKLLDRLIIDGFNNRQSPENMAKEIIDNIGLTEVSYQASINYEKSLRDLSKRSLDLELRDRNYDELVLGAILIDRSLTEAQINRMVRAYKKQAFLSRMEQMAETSSGSFFETGAAVAATLFDNVLGVFGFETVKQWRSMRDSKVRYTHTHASLDGQVVRENEKFLSVSGARLNTPRDPRAPMKETINCRCRTLRYVRPKVRN